MDKLLLYFKIHLNFKVYIKMVSELKEKCSILNLTVYMKVVFLVKNLMDSVNYLFQKEEQYKDNGIICSLLEMQP